MTSEKIQKELEEIAKLQAKIDFYSKWADIFGKISVASGILSLACFVAYIVLKLTGH